MKCMDQDLQFVLDFREKLKSPHKEFSGKELIDYIAESPSRKNLSRSEIANFAQKTFCNNKQFDNLIQSIGNSFSLEDSSKKKYRFIQDIFEDFKNDKNILNMDQNSSKEKYFYQYEDPTKRPGLGLLEKIEDILGTVYAEHGNEKGTLLNYKKLYDSYIFQWKLMPLLRRLPYMSLMEFVGKEDLIKSFFINIYNILMIHTRCIEFHKKKLEVKLDIKQISMAYKYVIGGIPFTLNQIKNGILQGNRPFVQTVWVFKVCSSAKYHISPNSPTSMLVLKSRDPRVNFTLNYGNKSSPALRVFSEKELEFNLEMATKNFVQSQVQILTKGKSGYTMLINRLFVMTAEEFGKEFKMIEFIVNHLRDKKFQAKLEEEYRKNPGSVLITYSRYDWAINHSYI
jgi:Protein of unknown function, DUF547